MRPTSKNPLQNVIPTQFKHRRFRAICFFANPCITLSLAIISVSPITSTLFYRDRRTSYRHGYEVTFSRGTVNSFNRSWTQQQLRYRNQTDSFFHLPGTLPLCLSLSLSSHICTRNLLSVLSRTPLGRLASLSHGLHSLSSFIFFAFITIITLRTVSHRNYTTYAQIASTPSGAQPTISLRHLRRICFSKVYLIHHLLPWLRPLPYHRVAHCVSGLQPTPNFFIPFPELPCRYQALRGPTHCFVSIYRFLRLCLIVQSIVILVRGQPSTVIIISIRMVFPYQPLEWVSIHPVSLSGTSGQHNKALGVFWGSRIA